MACADLAPLQPRLAGGEAGLYEEELVEDEPVHRGSQLRTVGREVDLVEGVVQIREPLTRQQFGGERVQDAAGRREGAVDEGPHPPRLYTPVDRIDGYEPPRVWTVVTVRFVDDLDALGHQLNAVATLHLARDYDPGVG